MLSFNNKGFYWYISQQLHEMTMTFSSALLRVVSIGQCSGAINSSYYLMMFIIIAHNNMQLYSK